MAMEPLLKPVFIHISYGSVTDCEKAFMEDHIVADHNLLRTLFNTTTCNGKTLPDISPTLISIFLISPIHELIHAILSILSFSTLQGSCRLSV
jgi:hypothetical protein